MGLSKIKISAKATAACDDFQHAERSDLIFLNNRQHHTNVIKKAN